MRIISGKFKGHKLVSFDEDHIRPTTDRVKESLFNIIAPRLEGARVLDLYSGTGNLGLEALSREAAIVEMVEINRRSIEIISRNLRNLKVQDGVIVHKIDVIEFVKKYKGAPFDLIFIDPPFPSRICLATLEALDASPIISNESLAVIEHSRQEPLPESVGGLRRVDSRSYGDKLLGFYKKGSG